MQLPQGVAQTGNLGGERCYNLKEGGDAARRDHAELKRQKCAI
jgi:hypothetical protein